MPTLLEPPSGSPFLSIAEKDPNRRAAKLRTLIISDLKAVPQRIAQLSQWLSARNHSFSIDLILVVGVSRPAVDCKTPHQAFAEQANDSVTIAQLELICPRVVYVPGLHEHPSAWESKDQLTPCLTQYSHNAVAGPLHVAPDLYIVHRRFADGISDKPVHHLPLSWRHTIYAKLTRPQRFRIPPQPSAIVLCSSQLPDAHTSKTKAKGFFTTVRSLLSLHNRSSVPELDLILAIAPPKMQRIPNSSNVFRRTDRTLDPSSFSDGSFCLATFVRPDIWDPMKEPYVDRDQLACEIAWEVENITKYNLDYKMDDEDDDEDEHSGSNGSSGSSGNSFNGDDGNGYSDGSFGDDDESVSDYSDPDQAYSTGRANRWNQNGGNGFPSPDLASTYHLEPTPQPVFTNNCGKDKIISQLRNEKMTPISNVKLKYCDDDRSAVENEGKNTARPSLWVLQERVKGVTLGNKTDSRDFESSISEVASVKNGHDVNRNLAAPVSAGSVSISEIIDGLRESSRNVNRAG